MKFIRDFQPTIIALILLLAVVVYCMFNRYDLIRVGDGGALIVDHLTGDCLTTRGKGLSQ